jgi:adenylate cyclase
VFAIQKRITFYVESLMATEIERRFRVADLSIIAGCQAIKIVQGYVSEKGKTVRVRIADNEAFLTIKGKRTGKCTKKEYEYPIPMEDALEMLENECENRIIQKTRYIVYSNSVKFEVDVFEGEYEGLVIAEVELKNERQYLRIPAWLGKELTGKKRYSNRSLACAHPKLRLVA